LVGAILDSVNGFASGKVYLISGRDGSEISSFIGDRAASFFGLAVDQIGDVNGDRVPDFLMAAAGSAPFNAPSTIYSGADYSILLTIDTLLSPNNGWISGAGDVNGDGYADLIVGEPQFDTHVESAGRVRVLSVKRLFLTADTSVVSITSGGTHTLRIDAGPENAGHAYLMLGFFSGTSPGIDLGNLTLALNPDAYTLFTLRQPNPMIQNSAGILDASGKAIATFVLPGNLISGNESGLLLHHAFVLFGPSGLKLSSNPLPLLLTK
jgi:hypothetical protein